MKNLPKVVSFVQDVSSASLRFVRNQLGVRDFGAPPLEAAVSRQLNKHLRLYMLTVTSIATLLGVLYWQVWKAVGVAFDAGTPIPSMTVLHERWQWMSIAALFLGLVSFVVMIWALRLRFRFTVQYLFPSLALLLMVSSFIFRPAARRIGESQLARLYGGGVRLFDESKWDDCYAFFHRFLYVFPISAWTDNSLGRIGGAKFWQREYITALQYYSDVLRRYPTSDIAPSIRRSILWTMGRIGRENSAEMCFHQYDRTGLSEFGISPFAFFLGEPKRGESAMPELFDSVHSLDGDGETHRSKIELFLERFPSDPWTPRAAFYVGDTKTLSTFPASGYAKSANVVQGWWLQRNQHYAEAAKHYEAFLATRPLKPDAEKVTQLLAQCYFASTNLDAALEKLTENERNRIALPADRFFLILESFAYTESPEEVLRIYDKWHDRLPLNLARDLSWVAIERMQLEGMLPPKKLVQWYSSVKRLPERAKTPVPTDAYSSVGDFIEDDFYFGPDVVEFVNSRLKQTREDGDGRHYFDRNYARDVGPWRAPELFNYTSLLNRYASNAFTLHLTESTNLHSNLEYVYHSYQKLDYKSMLMPVATAFLNNYVNAGVVVSDRELELLTKLRETPLARQAEALSHLKVRALPMNESGMRKAFVWVGAIPIEMNVTNLNERVGSFLRSNATTDSIGSSDIVFDELIHSKSRTRLFNRLAPQLTDALLVNGTTHFARVRDRYYAHVLEGLRTPATYEVALEIVTKWLTKWPKEDLADNLRMWQAWLTCWDANRERNEQVAYLERYQDALQIYALVGAKCRQERVKLMALESARRIRRKISLIQKGVISPVQTKIPGELRYKLTPRRNRAVTESDFDNSDEIATEPMIPPLPSSR